MGHWLCEVLLRDTSVGSHSMIQIANAFFITIASVFCVIILDKCADKAKVEKNETSARKGDQTNTNAEQSLSLDLLKVSWDRLQNQTTDVSNIERAIRTVIDSFGLLVGLCWEKATDAAIETIIEGHHTLHHHMVISKICAAVVVLLFMFPAWLYIIIPSAEMTAEEHESQMELTRIQAGSDKSQHEMFVMQLCRGLDDQKVDELFKFIQKQRDPTEHETSALSLSSST